MIGDTPVISATSEWRLLLNELLEVGTKITPTSLGANWRGKVNKEMLGIYTRVPMTLPVVLCPGRKLGYRFLAAEAAWILSGDNRLETIVPYAKALVNLSDDGRTLSGAYGPPFIDQLSYTTRALTQDEASRQAVITLWRPRPELGLEIPCSLTLQFIIRDATLHTLVMMRSSDAWMGLPYDWHCFSMMSAYQLLILRDRYPDLLLGDLTVMAGSQHLYQTDWEKAQECVDRNDLLVEDMNPLDLTQLDGPEDLIQHLWEVARYHPEKGWEDDFGCDWLKEVV